MQDDVNEQIEASEKIYALLNYRDQMLIDALKDESFRVDDRDVIAVDTVSAALLSNEMLTKEEFAVGDKTVDDIICRMQKLILS